jgi:hypothetical protein
MNYITDEELEAVFKIGLNKSHVEGLRAVWNRGYDRAVNPASAYPNPVYPDQVYPAQLLGPTPAPAPVPPFKATP